MATKKDNALDIDNSLVELETLVDRLEQGGMSMEESLSEFARGVELTRHCQQSLEKAEQRIKLLTRDTSTGEESLEPIQADQLDKS